MNEDIRPIWISREDYTKALFAPEAEGSFAELADREVIADSAVPLGRFFVSGVYFLVSNFEPVYVGQSTNVYNRVSQHYSEGVKTFDSVSLIRCEPYQLNLIESFYIHTLTPEYNKAGVAPIGAGQLAFELGCSVDELIQMQLKNFAERTHLRQTRLSITG